MTTLARSLLDLPHADAAPASAQPAQATFITYRCRAEHQRLAPITRGFAGDVPMVRITLHETDRPTLQTPVGVVKPDDHLLYTVHDVRERYAAELDRPIARVDMITPGRVLGTRFSPIALLLGYEHAHDPAPSFFIVEAGTAGGEAKILYLGKHMHDELEYATGYKPTPLASRKNIYRSRLRMASAHEPHTLVVEAHTSTDAEPHLRITARFERHSYERAPLPALLSAEAALRMATVAADMHRGGPLVRAAGALGAKVCPWKGHK